MLKKILKVLVGIVVVVIIALLVFGIVKYCVIEKNSFESITQKIKEKINLKETNETETTAETEESITKIYIDEPEEDLNVSLDAAKVIVLTDAAPDLSEVEFIKTETEEEDGFFKWYISFKTHDTKYDYVVSAYDGRIIEKNKRSIE